MKLFNSVFLSKTPHIHQDEMCAFPPKMITHGIWLPWKYTLISEKLVCQSVKGLCLAKAKGRRIVNAVGTPENAFHSWITLLLVPQKSHFLEERVTGIPSGHILTAPLWPNMSAHSYILPWAPSAFPGSQTNPPQPRSTQVAFQWPLSGWDGSHM